MGGGFGGYVPAATPNNIFLLGFTGIPYGYLCCCTYIGTAPYGVCDGYGQHFLSCGLIAETENSLTYAGGIGYPYSDSFGIQGSGGTATITWS